MLQRKLDAIVAESSADSALDPNSDAQARFQPSHDTRPRQFSDLQARANRASSVLPRQKENLQKDINQNLRIWIEQNLHQEFQNALVFRG